MDNVRWWSPQGPYLNKSRTPITVLTITGPHDAFKIINGGCDINYSRFVTVTNEPNSIYPTRIG